MLSILEQTCYNRIVSELLEQPCNKSGIFVKLVISCQKVWNNLLTTLEQAVRTHLVDGLSADLLQVVSFYVCTCSPRYDHVLTDNTSYLFQCYPMQLLKLLKIEKLSNIKY